MIDTTRGRLDGRAVWEILEIEDAAGVLSLYCDAGGRRGPAARLALRHALRRALDGGRRAGAAGQSRRDAARALLDSLRDDLLWLTDGGGDPGGRALFAPLSGGRLHRLSLDVPLGTAAVVGARPHVAPLVRARDEGRPVGVLAGAADGASLWDVRLGRARPVPPATPDGGAEPRPPTPEALARAARRYEWHGLVAASPHQTEGSAVLPVPVVAARRPLVDPAARDVVRTARRAAPRLHAVRRARLIARARAGGAGVAGPAEVIRALERGRVAHLVVPASAPPGGRVAHMLELALLTEADITLIPPDEAAVLSDRGGAAAVLRW